MVLFVTLTEAIMLTRRI